MSLFSLPIVFSAFQAGSCVDLRGTDPNTSKDDLQADQYIPTTFNLIDLFDTPPETPKSRNALMVRGFDCSWRVDEFSDWDTGHAAAGTSPVMEPLPIMISGSVWHKDLAPNRFLPAYVGRNSSSTCIMVFDSETTIDARESVQRTSLEALETPMEGASLEPEAPGAVGAVGSGSAFLRAREDAAIMVNENIRPLSEVSPRQNFIWWGSPTEAVSPTRYNDRKRSQTRRADLELLRAATFSDAEKEMASGVSEFDVSESVRAEWRKRINAQFSYEMNGTTPLFMNECKKTKHNFRFAEQEGLSPLRLEKTERSGTGYRQPEEYEKHDVANDDEFLKWAGDLIEEANGLKGREEGSELEGGSKLDGQSKPVEEVEYFDVTMGVRYSNVSAILCQTEENCNTLCRTHQVRDYLRGRAKIVFLQTPDAREGILWNCDETAEERTERDSVDNDSSLPSSDPPPNSDPLRPSLSFASDSFPTSPGDEPSDSPAPKPMGKNGPIAYDSNPDSAVATFDSSPDSAIVMVHGKRGVPLMIQSGAIRDSDRENNKDIEENKLSTEGWIVMHTKDGHKRVYSDGSWDDIEWVYSGKNGPVGAVVLETEGAVVQRNFVSDHVLIQGRDGTPIHIFKDKLVAISPEIQETLKGDLEKDGWIEVDTKEGRKKVYQDGSWDDVEVSDSVSGASDVLSGTSDGGASFLPTDAEPSSAIAPDVEPIAAVYSSGPPLDTVEVDGRLGMQYSDAATYADVLLSWARKVDGAVVAGRREERRMVGGVNASAVAGGVVESVDERRRSLVADFCRERHLKCENGIVVEPGLNDEKKELLADDFGKFLEKKQPNREHLGKMVADLSQLEWDLRSGKITQKFREAARKDISELRLKVDKLKTAFEAETQRFNEVVEPLRSHERVFFGGSPWRFEALRDLLFLRDGDDEVSAEAESAEALASRPFPHGWSELFARVGDAEIQPENDNNVDFLVKFVREIIKKPDSSSAPNSPDAPDSSRWLSPGLSPASSLSCHGLNSRVKDRVKALFIRRDNPLSPDSDSRRDFVMEIWLSSGGRGRGDPRDAAVEVFTDVEFAASGLLIWLERQKEDMNHKRSRCGGA